MVEAPSRGKEQFSGKNKMRNLVYRPKGEPLWRGFGDRKAAEGALGLSKSHISIHSKEAAWDQFNKTNALTLYEGAKLVQIKVKYIRHSELEFNEEDSTLRKNKRGEVTDWSPKARARFKRKIAKCKRGGLRNALMLTVTYPKEFPAVDDHHIYKGHLNQLNNYFRENDICGFWKLEFQDRGAPHYHYVLLPKSKIKNLDNIRKDLSKRWYEIVGSGDHKHLQAGITLEHAKTIDGTIGYLTGYMSKEYQLRPGNFTGHYTGTVNRKLIPWGKENAIHLGREKALRVRRILRKGIQKSMESYHYHKIQKRIKKEYNKYYSKHEIKEAFLGRETSYKLGQYLKWLEIKKPHKWRMRNVHTVNWIVDADNLEACLTRYLTTSPRNLRNGGVLP